MSGICWGGAITPEEFIIVLDDCELVVRVLRLADEAPLPLSRVEQLADVIYTALAASENE